MGGKIGHITFDSIAATTVKNKQDMLIANLILEKAPALKLEAKAKEDGMIIMTQDGYFKALEGITTIEEVLRVSRD